MERRSMMLSELLGNPVRDAEGRSVGRLHDIVARIDGADPPRIVGLLLRRKGEQLFLPIAAVLEFRLNWDVQGPRRGPFYA